MKKRILLILALIALFVISMLAVSCSGEEKIVLNVYNWGEYISDGSEDSVDVNAEFEKYCKTVLKKNVEVNYTTFESNESMTDYTVRHPSAILPTNGFFHSADSV